MDASDRDSSRPISVVIPTLNGAETLRECLESLHRQKHPRRLEVVAVDSGSHDATLEILSRFPVRVERIAPHLFNHGETRNFGARIASGDPLVFVSQDVVPADENWLSRLVQPLEEDERVAGVYSRVVPLDGHCNPLNQRILLESRFYGERRKVKEIADRRAYESLDEGARRELLSFENVSSCIRRSVLEKIPFRRLVFGEDIAWARDVLEAGWRIVYEPTSIACHAQNFSLVSAARRYYLDARFQQAVFRYPVRAGLGDVVRGLVYEVERDFQFLRPYPLWTKLPWLLYSPFFRATLVLAQYLGTRKGLQAGLPA